jgi:hypothetical protein
MVSGAPASAGTKFGGGEREGGAGIPFPRTPFPSRPARALGGGRECRAPRGTKSQRRDFVQSRFGFCPKSTANLQFQCFA